MHSGHRAARLLPPHAAPRPAATVDVCALGKTYGGWRPDSPQAQICRRTYGN
ncbi:hypothetical protein AB0436_13075 [Streptomyces sp. NPDC051322]|uniref:hypothetical protein n=1 Tax=Streptomyces sp. NPDC051322 TaxID=3154645 RepID=UPI00344F0F6B